MTQLELIHEHDSRARRLRVHYRETQSRIEQLAQHLRDEGDGWASNRVRALVAALEQIEAEQIERSLKHGTEGNRP